MFSTLQNTSVDWGYHVDKSNKAGKLLPHNISWPSGKFIGGSGGMNVMFYVRGNQRDYDNWEQLGNPTWNWQNVLEYFNKLETYNVTADATPVANELHGTNGPLHVNPFNNDEPFKQVLFDAAQELGYKKLDDINGNEYVGIGTAPGTVEQGRRYNSAKAYLAPAKNRTNLHVIKFAHVTKINVDNTTGQVQGVQFAINKTHELNVTVTKEVILSAGSIGTPHILQLSGIGPEKYFQRLNMSTVRNLYAGWSLQNHISVPIFLKFNVTPSAEQADGEKTATPTETATPVTTDPTDDLYNYIKQRKGVFSEQSVFDVIGFFNTVNVTDAYPNIGTHYAVFKRDDNIIIGEYLKQLGFNESVSQPIIDANKEADIAIVFVTLLNPVAMGKVRLRSADPYDLPIIQANFLDRREDIATLVQGVQLTRKFLDTAAFNQTGVTELIISMPECETVPVKKSKTKTTTPKPPKQKSGKKSGKKSKGEEIIVEPTTVAPEIVQIPEAIPYGSDQYWECYVKQVSTTLYHPVGTAKMGPATDRFAVVDSRLNVHGLKGLRVIDASIMPKIVSANVNAATIMIAEKGSDFIKEDYPAIAEPIVDEVVELNIETNDTAGVTKDEL